jgi:hypothetical protein
MGPGMMHDHGHGWSSFFSTSRKETGVDARVQKEATQELRSDERHLDLLATVGVS